MTRVNKTTRVEKFREEAWKKLLGDTHATSSLDTFIKKLGTVLTPSEILMLEKRLIILSLLKKGIGCREIGRLIDVSTHTVTYVKNNFAKKHRAKIPYVPPRERAQRRRHRSSKGVFSPF